MSFMAMVLGGKRVDCWGIGFAIRPGPWEKKREMDGWVMGGTYQKFVNNMRDWRVGWNVSKLATYAMRCDSQQDEILIKVDLYIQFAPRNHMFVQKWETVYHLLS